MNSATTHIPSMFHLLLFFAPTGPYQTLGIGGACDLGWGNSNEGAAQVCGGKA
jgi:hypothetical protein